MLLIRFLPAWSLLLAALTGCGRPAPLIVGSKNFTEQLILGEIAACHAERRLQIRVERKLNLGGTILAHQALVSGGIDLYPEYSGTALTAVLKLKPGADGVEARVRKEYAERFDVVWMPPLGFNNTFAIVVRSDDPRLRSAKTISDVVRMKHHWRLAVGYEFTQRPDGLSGFLRAYPLELDATPRSMDLGLLYRALEEQEADIVVGNSTDGIINAHHLKVLEDDRGYFPSYKASYAVRRDALERFPGLREALEELSGKIDEQTMQRLNYEVDGNKRRPREVAEEFLESLS